CVLGAAQLVYEKFQTERIKGRVRFIFQPAEEKANDNGKSGATLMIEDGVLEGLQGLLALHVHPSLPAGVVGVRPGPLLAACDTFDAVIEGKGGHAAEPHTGIDPIVLSSHAIQALQQVVSRRKAATEPAVVSVGGIRSKTYASNILPD